MQNNEKQYEKSQYYCKLKYLRKIKNEKFGNFFNTTHIEVDSREKLRNLKFPNNLRKIKIGKPQQKLMDSLCKPDCQQYYLKYYHSRRFEYPYFYIKIRNYKRKFERIIYSPKLTLFDYCSTLGGLLSMYYGMSIYFITYYLFKLLSRNLSRFLTLPFKTVFKIIGFITNFILFSLMFYQLYDLTDEFINNNNKLLVKFSERIYIPTISFIFENPTYSNNIILGEQLFEVLIKHPKSFMKIIKPSMNYASLQIFSHDKIINFPKEYKYLRVEHEYIRIFTLFDSDELNILNLSRVDKIRLTLNRFDYDFIKLQFVTVFDTKNENSLGLKSNRKYILKLDPIFYIREEMNCLKIQGNFHELRRQKCIENCISNGFTMFNNCIPFFNLRTYIKMVKNYYLDPKGFIKR